MARNSTPITRTSTKRHARSAAPAPAEMPAVAAPVRRPAAEEIARLAYSYWEQRGREHGSHEMDWYRAELELSGAAK